MDADQEQIIKENIDLVRLRIAQAAKRCGRDEKEIDLVAVTKQKPAQVIKILAENGISRIGESYLQEAEFKIDLLQDLAVEWHMVGNIQHGKEKHIANRFHVVHSVGEIRTARQLDQAASRIDRILPVFLELNLSGEGTKQGWAIRGEEDLGKLLPEWEEILDCHSLQVRGLMTMAPYSLDPEKARPYFKQMRMLRDSLASAFPGAEISELSMGMSGDYEVAIEEGATVVRIGSALVGPR